MAKKRKLINKQMLKAYRAARPRLLSVLPKLQEKGWTRKDLFKIGRLKYPHGPWGIAWSSVWLKPGMRANILEDGTITFSWKEGRCATEKIITQIAKKGE